MTSQSISPAEHPKRHPPPVRPNAHPYAIKTTSSALLSRSNSSPHSAHHARHHYIPLSHSLIPPRTRARHRHSSSLSSVEGEAHTVRTNPVSLPTPLPIVAAASDSSSVSLKRADEPKLIHRVWKAGTMSSGSATEPITGDHSDDQKYFDSCDRDCGPAQALHAVLSPNPKQWSTDELIIYLTTSLKSSDNTDRDANLVDVLECVRARSLTGRNLLRLTDADLVGTPLTEVQCAHLLQCSRALRADVLRGRIYVDSYHSHKISDDSNDIYSRFARSSTPSHSIRGASVSVDNLDLLLDNNTVEGEYAFPPSPTIPLRRSNSVSDTSAERYRDLARMRTRRRGKVKGLVETWERASTSGSECSAGEEGSASASEVDSESETDPELYSMPDTEHSLGSPSELSSTVPDDDVVTMADSAGVPEASLAPPPPYTHVSTAHDVAGDEEPSIEELLASSPSVPLTGARAWEADFGLGETVKRIPACASADVGDTSTLVVEPDTPRRPKDQGEQAGGGSIRTKRSSGRRSAGGRQKNAKTQKRVVTAIFTGSSADDLSENPSDAIHSMDQGSRKSDAHDDVRGDSSVDSDLQSHSDSALRALEESIAATRTQMDALRLRLEEVEADTSRQEAILIQAQLHDSRRIPPSGIRQRRSKANEQVTARIVEPSRDEMLVENVRNRDVLEGWETVPLADIARAMVARAIRWVFPYGHLGPHAHEDHDGLHARTGSRPQEDKKQNSPVKGNGRLSLARASCSIILVSFALCATVLRRIGFGRWFRGP